MTTVTQLLCGEVSLHDTDAMGLEVLRPHVLQLSEGVCAHTDVAEWERRTRHLAGLKYAGRVGDAEWPVHLWTDGSVHGIGPDPNFPVKDKREDKPLPECEHAEHYACAPVKVKAAVELGPHPEPAVTSRDGADVVAPSAVLKLQERALEWGWDVRRQYAWGHSLHGATGRPLAAKESWALIFHSHPMTDAGAYAVYRGGSWDSVNVAGRMVGGVTELSAWLAEPELSP